MIKECIILAGGLGTRLSSEIADLPKCMAPVAGKPFLHWVIQYLLTQGVESFVFSLGYKHEKMEAFINESYAHLNTKFSIEKEPLGTGGAVKLALHKCTHENVLVLNGDTLFEINIPALYTTHFTSKAACTLALKTMQYFDRYGCVTINASQQVVGFNEKQFLEEGLINGGVYLLNKKTFTDIDFPEEFSFENDFLEKYIYTLKLMAVIDDGYFIDIGIPEDYKKAKQDFNIKYHDSIS
jgi:D-glycero-alpha-D-manno-heptose 1-phosphate guanylyltransferase